MINTLSQTNEKLQRENSELKEKINSIMGSSLSSRSDRKSENRELSVNLNGVNTMKPFTSKTNSASINLVAFFLAFFPFYIYPINSSILCCIISKILAIPLHFLILQIFIILMITILINLSLNKNIKSFPALTVNNKSFENGLQKNFKSLVIAKNSTRNCPSENRHMFFNIIILFYFVVFGMHIKFNNICQYVSNIYNSKSLKNDVYFIKSGNFTDEKYDIFIKG